MLRIVLVRPGCTDFDQQGRIKGSLDIPLCDAGAKQAAQLAADLADMAFDTIYTAPCQSAQQTAQLLAKSRRLKLKLVEELRNVDHGLWHGKLIDEVKQNQPRVYRQGQEHGETICPPGGEPIAAGRERIGGWLTRMLKKHKSGTVCCVVPEPLASVFACELQHCELADLWEAELDDAAWQMFEVIPQQNAAFIFRGIVHGSHTVAEIHEVKLTATVR
jgi:probable phosphoglycerate mutase